jgi:hypothetical protein
LWRAEHAERVVLVGCVGDAQTASFGDESPGVGGLGAFKDKDGGSEHGGSADAVAAVDGDSLTDL